MKTNIKALQLIEKGFSAKTISKLNEGEINILHKKLLGEAQITTSQTLDLTADDVKKGYKVPDTMMAGKKNVVVTPNPITAQPSDDYGYTITINESPSDYIKAQTSPLIYTTDSWRIKVDTITYSTDVE